MSQRNRINNIVTSLKPQAEVYLRQAQKTKVIPRNFSGFTASKIKDYIYVYQFSKNKLIGCVIINKNNIENFSGTISRAVTSVDLGDIYDGMEEESEPDTTPAEHS